MVARKPAPRALAARRETRKALLEALASIRAAKRAIVKTGAMRTTVYPAVFPPQTPTSVCKTITTDSIVLNPPYVPFTKCRAFYPPRVPFKICGIPPRGIDVTREDFRKGLEAIELWIRYVQKVFDTAASKRPALPKPKARR